MTLPHHWVSTQTVQPPAFTGDGTILSWSRDGRFPQALLYRPSGPIVDSGQQQPGETVGGESRGFICTLTPDTATELVTFKPQHLGRGTLDFALEMPGPIPPSGSPTDF